MKNNLSIIIPAYNEERRIGKTLKDYCLFFDTYKSRNDLEIIVVADGMDGTAGIVKESSKNYGFIKCLEFQERLGKGGALLKGFYSSTGNIIGFVDADGSINPKDLTSMVHHLIRYELDGVIGSRWITGSYQVERYSFSRTLLSRLMNLFVHIFFRLGYHDTQCGAKVFQRKVIESCSQNLEFYGYIFDIDLLLSARKKGFRIEEMPIKWVDSAESKVTFMDAFKIVRDLFILRLKSFGDTNASC
jgi:glycosyltransferase involved in cell wall biosynthesis